MKKIIFTIVFCFMVAISFGQAKYTYCEIVGTGNILGTKVTINIDFGDPHKFGQQNWIKDNEGKIQKFNSMIDALNYMGDQGWEFVQAYTISNGQNTHVYHYLMKMEIKEENK